MITRWMIFVILLWSISRPGVGGLPPGFGWGVLRGGAGLLRLSLLANMGISLRRWILNGALCLQDFLRWLSPRANKGISLRRWKRFGSELFCYGLAFGHNRNLLAEMDIKWGASPPNPRVTFGRVPKSNQKDRLRGCRGQAGPPPAGTPLRIPPHPPGEDLPLAAHPGGSRTVLRTGRVILGRVLFGGLRPLVVLAAGLRPLFKSIA